ncbi:MAG: hypothetical protein LBU18_02680 [Treponema sp.]|jgi:epoxyqueuosine reductase|nr:hypothetical protein [Treponema sp.]
MKSGELKSGELKSGELKEEIRSAALHTGFVRARILAPFEPVSVTPSAEPGRNIYHNRILGARSAIVAALPYGNQPLEGKTLSCTEIPPGSGGIALFARRNYYREAVRRLQSLAAAFRARYGGIRSDYRIFCNSPVPEKPLAHACGLGVQGRNSLIITAEAGSMVIIAAMTLPLKIEADEPVVAERSEMFPLCATCDLKQPPCKAACPTGAVLGDGKIDTKRCIQWYASGKGAMVPPEVARHWGRRLYGCTECQDACIRNRRPILGAQTSEGPLPAYLDCQELIEARNEELKTRFKGTAMGLSWLGPEGIRRNARLVLEHSHDQ